MIFTTNFFQLFYLVSPQSLVGTAIQIEHNVRDWRLIARFLTVVAWQFFAWMLAIKILLVKKFKMQINETV
jgi:hypothetical protein